MASPDPCPEPGGAAGRGALSHVLVLLLLLLRCAALAGSVTDNGGPTDVDFRHAPPDRQTATCLPDGPQKTLIDDSGRLLHHYLGGQNFALTVSVQVTDGARQTDQELVSPRVPIVHTTRRPEDFRFTR